MLGRTPARDDYPLHLLEATAATQLQPQNHESTFVLALSLSSPSARRPGFFQRLENLIVSFHRHAVLARFDSRNGFLPDSSPARQFLFGQTGRLPLSD